MDELNKNIIELNQNIISLNKMLSNLFNTGNGTGFSLEILKDALLDEQVQALITEITQYYAYHKAPLKIEGRKIFIEEQKLNPLIQNTILINEKKTEQDTVNQEKIIEKKINKQNIVLTDKYLYAISPAKEGYFSETCEYFETHKSLYFIELTSDIDGVFSIPDGVDFLKLVKYHKKNFEYACEYLVPEYNTETEIIKIKTLEKGVVKKDEKGWKIIKKAQLRIEKETKPKE